MSRDWYNLGLSTAVISNQRKVNCGYEIYAKRIYSENFNKGRFDSLVIDFPFVITSLASQKNLREVILLLRNKPNRPCANAVFKNFHQLRVIC